MILYAPREVQSLQTFILVMPHLVITSAMMSPKTYLF